MALVCETVTASTTAALRAERDRAQDADMVELRLDGVADLDVAAALHGRTRPVVVTCRAAWEGGAFGGSEAERIGVLNQASQLGADFVDVEWRADRSALRLSGRTRLVLSHHDHAGMPGDLADRVRAMRAEAGQGVIKVAVTTRTFAECRRLRDMVGTGGEQVVIGMGHAGTITRVCPWIYGSQWTYCGTAAPGQLSRVELIDTYRVRQTGPRTRVYGIIGTPLSHSASPAMHNAAFAAKGIDAVYVPIETADANDFLVAADGFGLAGASVTAPVKTQWAAHGVRLDAASTRIGAINTLVRAERGEWEGRNVDVDGFLGPLARRGLQMTGQRVVVLGAGGAARATVWALARQGAQIEVCARRLESAARLAADFGATAVAWPPRPDWDLLVNATPVGTWPAADQSPLPRESVRGGLVYDLVYNPPETTLMKLARDAGADAISGLEMLVGQARAQFEYWTGTTAPESVMERAAADFLSRRTE
ncbi:MAG TPA: type I 3-dehydroquinate dehydratase [Vicinamibacterales bacterium]|nr:type I 3-dehydroquinate dehydratase [Vicinamibacterales bacterium]